MFILVIMLAVALVMTGGACGLQPDAAFANSNVMKTSNASPIMTHTEDLYPGSPARCCFERVSDGSFKGDDWRTDFLSMIVSEVLLVLSSVTRIFNFRYRIFKEVVET